MELGASSYGRCFTGAVYGNEVLPCDYDLLQIKKQCALDHKLMLMYNRTEKNIRIERGYKYSLPVVESMFSAGQATFLLDKNKLHSKFPVLFFNHGDMVESKGSVAGLAVLIQDDPMNFGPMDLTFGKAGNGCHIRNWRDTDLPMELPCDLAALFIVGEVPGAYVVQVPKTPITGHSLDLACFAMIQAMMFNFPLPDNVLFSGAVRNDAIQPLSDDVRMIKGEFADENGMQLVAVSSATPLSVMFHQIPAKKLSDPITHMHFKPIDHGKLVLAAEVLSLKQAYLPAVLVHNDHRKSEMLIVRSCVDREAAPGTSRTMDGHLHGHYGQVFKVKTGGDVELMRVHGEAVVPLEEPAYDRSVALALNCMSKFPNNFAFSGDVVGNAVIPISEEMAKYKLKACQALNLNLIANSSAASVPVKSVRDARTIIMRKTVAGKDGYYCSTKQMLNQITTMQNTLNKMAQEIGSMEGTMVPRTDFNVRSVNSQRGRGGRGGNVPQAPRQTSNLLQTTPSTVVVRQGRDKSKVEAGYKKIDADLGITDKISQREKLLALAIRAEDPFLRANPEAILPALITAEQLYEDKRWPENLETVAKTRKLLRTLDYSWIIFAVHQLVALPYTSEKLREAVKVGETPIAYG